MEMVGHFSLIFSKNKTLTLSKVKIAGEFSTMDNNMNEALSIDYEALSIQIVSW